MKNPLLYSYNFFTYKNGFALNSKHTIGDIKMSKEVIGGS